MSVDLSQLTAHLSPEQQEAVKKAYRKKAENSTTAFLWCFFFGTFGAHRFYLRQWGAGLARLIFPVAAIIVIVLGIALQWPPATIAAIVIPLLLIALIWEVVDLFRIDHQIYERNLKLAEQLIASALLTDHSVEDKAFGRMEILMEQTAQATSAAATSEERQTAAEAAADAPEPVVAVSEAAPAAPAADSAEAIEARETESAGAGVAEAQYVASTVSEISATPGESEHSAPIFSPEHNWSEAALIHSEGESVATGEQAGEETLSEPDALGAAAVGVGMAAVGGAALDELVTRSHEETDHSATDSLETFTTLGVAESAAKDEAIAAETEAVSMAPPTTTESEAMTWPDHPPVSLDQAPAGAILSEDVTDMGMAFDEGAPPVADVEGAAPLFVSLAGLDAGALPEAPAAPAPQMGAADDAMLLLVPDEAAPTFEAEPLTAMDEAAAPPESYIPPTVPVVSVPEVSMPEPTPADSGPMFPPPLAPEAMPAPAPGHSEETLAELAGLAGGVGLAAGAAELLHSHDQLQPQPEPVSALPFMEPPPEPAPSAAPMPAEEPAMPPLPLAAEGAGVAAEAAPAEPPRRRLRRVREYLQVKRGDHIEELMAEEVIEIDEDPEPVRQRLRDTLHQQAVERGLE